MGTIQRCNFDFCPLIFPSPKNTVPEESSSSVDTKSAQSSPKSRRVKRKHLHDDEVIFLIIIITSVAQFFFSSRDSRKRFSSDSVVLDALQDNQDDVQCVSPPTKESRKMDTSPRRGHKSTKSPTKSQQQQQQHTPRTNRGAKKVLIK